MVSSAMSDDLKSKNIRKALLPYLPWSSLILISTLTQAFSNITKLRIDRQQHFSDQILNLLSCHFIHLDWSHWFANMLGVVAGFALAHTRASRFLVALEKLVDVQ